MFHAEEEQSASTTLIQLSSHETALCEPICLVCLGNSSVKRPGWWWQQVDKIKVLCYTQGIVSDIRLLPNKIRELCFGDIAHQGSHSACCRYSYQNIWNSGSLWILDLHHSKVENLIQERSFLYNCFPPVEGWTYFLL